MKQNEAVFPYGAVYRIQRQESLEQIRSELQKMKAAGMNIIVVWPAVYWWEDPALPLYPYHTGHEILQYAEQIGLKIVMELSGQITSLEYAPDFLMKEDYYAVKFDGSLLNSYPYFGYLNYNHPEVKQLIEVQFATAADHYKGYASLYGYDIWNETMFESYDCYTLQQFRDWLRAKYGSIAALNDAWDRVYRDFNQIHFNKWMWASVMPKVDYHRFQKEAVGRLLREWGQAVKAADPGHPLIADNIHSMIYSDSSYERPQDDWEVAQNVDQYGISFYPKDSHGSMKPWRRSLVFASARSASPTGRFWVSEMQTHMRHMFDPASVVRAEELRQWVWEAIAHGAKGLIYWKWDPFLTGLQTGARGLVNYRRQGTLRLEEASAIGQIVQRYEKELSCWQPQRTRALILFDDNCHDFTKAYLYNYKHSVSDSIYLDSLDGLYHVLWELNVPARFITPRDVIGNMPEPDQILFVSNQVNMDHELAAGLKRFMDKGGVVIADGKFGEVDELGLLHRQQPAGPLQELLGYTLIDVEPEGLDIIWQPGQELAVSGLKGYFEKKLLDAGGGTAEIMAHYADGFPAILKSSCGKGHLLYISTLLWYGYHQEHSLQTKAFMQRLAENYRLAPLAAIDNPCLRVFTLTGEEGAAVFIFNYTEEEAAGKLLLGMNFNEAAATNLRTGELQAIGAMDERAIPVTVPPHDVMILAFSFKQEA